MLVVLVAFILLLNLCSLNITEGPVIDDVALIAVLPNTTSLFTIPVTELVAFILGVK